MKKIIRFIYTLALLNFICFTISAQTYCSSKGTNTTHGYIKKISMETINNTSGNNGGYADFTSQSATLLAGATYTIELTPGFISGAAYFEYWTVYIDYNHDGVFEANEIVANGHNAIRINKSFSIPATALKGATRMRIQMQAGIQETNPCATFTYGEVEDYTVVINGSEQNKTVDAAKPGIKNTTEGVTGELKLYPSVAKDNLKIEFTSSNNTNVKVNVFNLSGQKLMNIENASFKGLNTFNLNTSKLGAGFYILEMENNGQRQYQKFLISR